MSAIERVRSWLAPRNLPAKEVERYSFDAWVQDRMRFGGMSYPLTGFTMSSQRGEVIDNSFAGYIQGAYKANGVVFAVCEARRLLFSEARPSLRRLSTGELFDDPALDILRRPWPGGTARDLLSRMEQDVTGAGTAFVAREGDRLRRLRPDWCEFILSAPPDEAVESDVVGFKYTVGGPQSRGESRLYTVEQVAAWAPIPDPEALYRGMSWLTPALEEIQADLAATRHKGKFFLNACTPNLSVSLKETVSKEDFQSFMDAMNASHRGVENAYKTLYVGGGADVKVVGADLKQLDFKVVQGAGETRVAAAGRVPPIIVGLSEGLQAATYCGTYNEAVWTTRGIVKLGEIAPGDAVWSFVGNQLEARKVVWHSQTGTKPVYTIKTKNRTIRFTDNHPVLVRVPGSRAGGNAERAPRVEWRRVDQLKVGDRVVQAQRLPDQGLDRMPDGAPATVDALQWLGAYTGDGCMNDGAVTMCLPAQDRARAHYADIAVRLFTKQTSSLKPSRRATDGLTPEMVRLRAEGLTYRQIVDRMGLTMHPMSVRDRIAIATREFTPPVAPVTLAEARNGFRFSSKTAVQWHRRMGVAGSATTKRVPGWVFELTEDLRLAYLAGIVDTDGSVGKDGRLAVQFSCRELVEDVRMLLISCGIQCSNIATTEYAAAVLPNPGVKETYRAWRFVASSALEVARIPFADPLYRERVGANQHRHRPGGLDAHKAGLHEDLGFYTIRSIEVGPPEPVYDIEVEGGHSFLADGVVVHNSNYGQARRAFGDHWGHPQWASAFGALAAIVDEPDDAELFYDARDIAFLREDRRDFADIQATQAGTISTLITAGYEPDSVVKAVLGEDFAQLAHTGRFSVQLLPPTEGEPAEDPAALEEGTPG